MYKKFLLSALVFLLFVGKQIQCVLYIVKSTTQKTNNLDAWMIWKTSKEYRITYHSNYTDANNELGLTMGKIKINAYKTTINKKNAILTGTSCNHLKIVEYNARHDIACGVNLSMNRYVIYHYRIFKSKKNSDITLLIQPVVEIPELDKYLKNDMHLYGFNANKDGTMVAIVLPDGTIAKIVPKRIPSKHLLTFNNSNDVVFKYLKNNNAL